MTLRPENRGPSRAVRSRLFPLAVLVAISTTLPAYAGWFDQLTSPITNGKSAMRDAPSVVLEKIFKLGGSPNAVAWSPDGRLLATADTLDRRITIWDYGTQTVKHTVYKTYFGLNSLAFTPDGRYVMTSAVSPKGNDSRVSFSLIDVTTGQVARNVDGPVENPTHIITNVAGHIAICSSTKFAASVTTNGNLEYLNLINTENWSLIGSHHIRIAADLSGNPVNSQFAVLSVGGDLEVWDAAADRRIVAVKAHTYSGAALAFSADGQSLASSEGLGLGDQTPDPDAIRLWNTSTWQMIAKTQPSPGEDFRARSLSFSPDGRYLASLNYDGKARLWDAKSLSLIEVVDDHETGGTAIAFAPDGRHVAIARDDKVTAVRIDQPR